MKKPDGGATALIIIHSSAYYRGVYQATRSLPTTVDVVSWVCFTILHVLILAGFYRHYVKYFREKK